MELKNLIMQRPVWLARSENPDPIILSAETAISRNLEKFPFPAKASLKQKSDIFGAVEKAVQKRRIMGDEPMLVNLNEVSDLAKTILFERDFVTIEMITSAIGDRGVILSDYSTAIRINGENHLRISCFSDGASVRSSWETADTTDTLLGKELTYAYDPAAGFLMNRPDQCGTGLEISFTLQLSGLVYTETLDQVLSGAAQLGLSGAGKFRQGTDSWGGMFTLTGGSFLGSSEDEILTKTEAAVREVVTREQEARAVLFREAPMEMEDKIWRAFGILQHSRMLSVPQLLNLTSVIRLGIDQGYDIEGISADTLNGIISAALQGNAALLLETVPSESSELDIQRASIVRSIISA